MQPLAPAVDESADWQRELALAIRDPVELLHALGLDPALAEGAAAAHGQFPLRVPRGYLARMRPGDPDDPLLRQVLPLGLEMAPAAGFGADPVGDLEAAQGAGILHKYQGRVLLVATGACAIHCRYCFRRHFPYADASAGADRWQAALAYLAARPEVSEVILSGGDPLLLSDRRLRVLVDGLQAIPQLKRLRIHSRLPVVLPQRIDNALLDWLCEGRLQPVMVIHANHAIELDRSVAQAVGRLRARGVSVLNQTVLLRAVNDTTASLAALSERLFAIGALPYYLHLLDKVQGAAHFEVTIDRARELAAELAATLPGYLVPKLVQERAGEPNKTLLLPCP